MYFVSWSEEKERGAFMVLKKKCYFATYEFKLEDKEKLAANTVNMRFF